MPHPQSNFTKRFSFSEITKFQIKYSNNYSHISTHSLFKSDKKPFFKYFQSVSRLPNEYLIGGILYLNKITLTASISGINSDAYLNDSKNKSEV